MKNTKHGRAGHQVEIDSLTGIMFCRTCGHHVLTDEQNVASELLAALQKVLNSRWLDHDRSFASYYREDVKMARAVIAAAGGTNERR